MNIAEFMTNKDDFLQPLLDLMQKNADRQEERMDRIDSKLEANTQLTNKIHEQTKKTNGRVNRHDQELIALTDQLNKLLPSDQKITSKNLEPWYRDPIVLRIILYVVLGFVLVAGAIVGVDLGGIL